MKLFRWFSFLVLVGIQGIFPGQGGSAEPSRAPTEASVQDRGGRVAIVIGNSNYPSGALVNPKSDATAMAASLKQLGFDVELKLDATKADFDAVLRRFSGKSEKAGVATLFYAGHGIQVGGSNYLVPIDANPRSERDLKRDMVKMDDIIDDMGDARVKLVFFDACRDNPLSRSFSRGGSRGMAAPVEATGTLISFATKHGNTASDGDGKHSPYTTALLAALENPGGVEIEQMLRRVQQGVKQNTKGQQEPWRYGSLDGDFYFKAPQAVGNRPAQQQEAIDRAVFDAVQKSREDAARERADLQRAMEQTLREALARQKAEMELERKARLAATGESATAPPTVTTTTLAMPQAQVPIKLASVAQTNSAGTSMPSEHALATVSGTVGDEWEYVTRDIFGKRQTVIARVKAVVPGVGVLEAYTVDGNESGEWVFDGKPSFLGIPIDAVLLFSPYWSGIGIDGIAILNGSSYPVKSVTGKIVGKERITVPAGSFDTTRIELQVGINPISAPVTDGNLQIVVWYSADQKRLVRQSVTGRSNSSQAGALINTIRETIELSAVRSGARKL